jgi:hypothetical protein
MKTSRRKSYDGMTFNRWYVAGDAPDIDGRRYIVCTCECGVTKTVILDHVVQGKSQSCGCLRKERQIGARGPRNPWKTTEIQLVEKYYPLGGANAVAKALPHRTIASIKMKASILGLRYVGYANAR